MAKKSGRLTLRITPELHEELASISDGLGIDINGLVNLMIRDSYSVYASQAATIKQLSSNYRENVPPGPGNPEVVREFKKGMASASRGSNVERAEQRLAEAKAAEAEKRRLFPQGEWEEQVSPPEPPPEPPKKKGKKP